MINVGCFGINRLNDVLIEVFRNDETLRLKPQESNADVIYINFGRNMVTKAGIKLVASAIFSGRAVVVHWVGSDVYNLMLRKESSIANYRMKMFLLKLFTRSSKVVHWCAAPHLQVELKALGIPSIVKYFPTPLLINDESVLELPSKVTVLSYLPESNHEFYRSDTVLQLALNNPDIRFDIIGMGNGLLPSYPNIKYHGWVDSDRMRELYQQSTCVVRIPKHDALGGTVIEGVWRGRYAIWSYEAEYVYRATDLLSSQRALDIIRTKRRVNYSGMELVRKRFSLERLSGSIKEGLLNAIK